jgi:hypothetical protein
MHAKMVGGEGTIVHIEKIIDTKQVETSSRCKFIPK